MPRYPYKTLRVFDGVEYVTVTEVEQMMRDALGVLPTLKTVTDSLTQISGAQELVQDLVKQLNQK